MSALLDKIGLNITWQDRLSLFWVLFCLTPQWPQCLQTTTTDQTHFNLQFPFPYFLLLFLLLLSAATHGFPALCFILILHQLFGISLHTNTYWNWWLWTQKESFYGCCFIVWLSREDFLCCFGSLSTMEHHLLCSSPISTDAVAGFDLRPSLWGLLASCARWSFQNKSSQGLPLAAL